ncbi:zinc-binding alcohol dehydrogenase family protein [Photobacterium satsumensis]|uniref:zinc-binding alcohol dehydrogenase family protein n=1 Tax=Photobacterium satsumensis TaxID=2910239 RepID=UPI003D149D98
MNALVCKDVNQLEYEQTTLAECKPHEVQLTVEQVGICGSDLHAFKGKQPMFDYPKIMGHEVCATISDVGAEISSFAKGQRVTVIPYKHCGKCQACTQLKTNCCESLSVLGVHENGAMAKSFNLDHTYVIPVPDSLSKQQIVTIEPYAISAHAVRRAQLADNETVLVIGAGTIGIAAADICLAYGHNVVIADIDSDRLQLAGSRFSLPTIQIGEPSSDQEIRRLLNGSPNVIIDATGHEKSMNDQIENVSVGGKVIFVGLHKGDVSFKDISFHKKEVTLFASRAATKDDFNEVIRLLVEQKIDTAKIISKTIPFTNVSSEFNSLYDKHILKTVIEM